MKPIIKRYMELPIQLKASVWFLICSFMQKGITVLTTPIFTRILTTSEFGRFQVFNSWLNILSVIVTMHMYLGMYTSGLVKHSDSKEVFSSSLQGLCTFLVLSWTVLYLLLRNIVKYIIPLSTIQMLAMFLMIWTTASFSFWAAEQRVALKYKSLVIVTIITSVSKPVLGIILVINSHDKVTARIVGLAIVELLMYSGCFFSQLRRGKKLIHLKYWKEALLFNIPLIPHYLSMTLLNDADKIMIEKMIGESEAGIYGIAYALGQLMRLFIVALSQTVEPWLYKQINNGDISKIKKIAYPLWVGLAILNLILILISPEIIRIFAPASYYDAIWVIPPVALSVYFIFLYMFFAVFEFYYNKTTYIAFATCIGAILNIVLNYIFIQIFGYYAAGYTTLVCYIAYAFMHYFFMRRICKKEIGNVIVYDSKLIVAMSLAFIVIGLLLLFTYRFILLRYLLLLGCLSVVYVFRKNVKTILINLIKSKKHQGV